MQSERSKFFHDDARHLSVCGRNQLHHGDWTDETQSCCCKSERLLQNGASWNLTKPRGPLPLRLYILFLHRRKIPGTLVSSHQTIVVVVFVSNNDSVRSHWGSFLQVQISFVSNHLVSTRRCVFICESIQSLFIPMATDITSDVLWSSDILLSALCDPS